MSDFSPLIEPDDAARAYFDAGGIGRQYGNERRFGRAILDEAARAGATARLGIGPGRWFAWAAARLSDPSTMLIVEDDQAEGFARSLPVDWLPLGSNAHALLRRLGIRTAGQFAGLPPTTIRPRFGPDATLAHRIARGHDPRPLQPQPVPMVKTLSSTAEPPLIDLSPVCLAAAALVARGCQELRADGAAYRALTLELLFDDGQTATETRYLSRPSAQEDSAATLLPTLVEALAHAPVVTVTVTLSGVITGTAEQSTLFDAGGRRERQVLRDRVVAEITRRYPAHLGTLLAHHPHAPLPEERWRFAVPTIAQPVRVGRNSRGQRVIWIGSRREVVRRCTHVWRLDLWWPSARHRRYVRVETCSGWHGVIYRDSVDGWFLAGRLD